MLTKCSFRAVILISAVVRTDVPWMVCRCATGLWAMSFIRRAIGGFEPFSSSMVCLVKGKKNLMVCTNNFNVLSVYCEMLKVENTALGKNQICNNLQQLLMYVQNDAQSFWEEICKSLQSCLWKPLWDKMSWLCLKAEWAWFGPICWGWTFSSHQSVRARRSSQRPNWVRGFLIWEREPLPKQNLSLNGKSIKPHLRFESASRNV